MRSSDYLKKMRECEAMGILESMNIKKLTAKDAMIKPVFVYSDDGADKILKKLKREDTNVCIVVTKDKKFVGEISDEDLIKLFLHQVKYEPITKLLGIGYRRAFLYKTADELTNKHKSTVNRDTPINKVIKLVHAEGFQYIPVLNKDRKVIGVVTPSSLLDLLEKN
ncbi:MAG: CBS domain-containing protein [Candidatus Altiarchaeota archaeon]|nr:CBS domain-containing protein [Candidatus Altiarchaeota archaeon]